MHPNSVIVSAKILKLHRWSDDSSKKQKTKFSKIGLSVFNNIGHMVFKKPNTFFFSPFPQEHSSSAFITLSLRLVEKKKQNKKTNT